MRNPGVRRVFVAKNPAEIARLRAEAGKQLNFVGLNLSPATISRMERGLRIREKAARAAHAKLAPAMPFEDIFELAPGKDKQYVLTWEQVSRAATRIGKKVFGEFRPDVILTFAGPSSIFTSIMMTKSLRREEFLRTYIHTGMFRDRRLPPTASEKIGFYTIPSSRFLVWVPRSLMSTKINDRASKRIVIIDDTVTTGSVLGHLRDFFVGKGFHRDNIRYVTCACSRQAWSDPMTRPDIWAYKMAGVYRMPWGEPL